MCSKFVYLVHNREFGGFYIAILYCFDGCDAILISFIVFRLNLIRSACSRRNRCSHNGKELSK